MKNIRKSVFYPTFLILIVIFVWDFIDNSGLNKALETVNAFIGNNLGFLYLLIALFAIIVCIIVCVSPFGKTKIGGENAVPMFSTWNWFCITLCTTVAAGLIFWGAAEPIYHIAAPPEFLGIEPDSYQASVFSMSTMFLHWTITPYAIYCVPALMFAIALYNYKKPFSFSSCFTPICKNTDSPIFSSAIDSICVFTTVMGIVASLGQGILSVAGGIEKVSGLESNQMMWGIVGVLIVVVFTISACSGVLKGIKWLSKINVYIFMMILTAVFLVGPTAFMIKLGLESAGVYLNNFLTRSLMFGAADPGTWSYFWTISTFANWMAWAPTVALFLGKISRGHSVRKFVLINLVAPAICSGVWITIFGGTSIFVHLNRTDLYEKIQQAGTESVVYEVLAQLPLGRYMIPILVLVTFISFVTASDSTTNALGDLCCRDSQNEPLSLMGVKIIWGVVIGAMAIIMINGNGIEGIKMVSAFGGFPAAFLVMFTGIALLKVCKNNKKKNGGKNYEHEKTTNRNGF